MDFFHSQESLTAIQWILRAIVAYFFMLLVAKVMGQRSISQLRLLDFVIALIIGNIIAHPLSDEQLGLKGSMLTTSVLIILYTASVIAGLKSRKLRKFFEPPPLPLIENGQILYEGLAKARISLDYLLSESRKEKIDDVQKIALALWEPDGKISFFLKPQYQHTTPKDFNLATQTFDLPRTIIKESKIIASELLQLNKDERWLRNTIKTMYHVEPDEILLATIDKNEQIKIFLYK
ncbi:DUF421 domain-containing protein [Bacillus sp. FJAT-50079]|uniref:DUF421 domain-containing protein n=1 Tax=Bacillus sp. FJAT-50079 TaxID=2833577 RepID=UPI001BC92A76|nr:DUF421 domain-containing protein [Bacillus sp. FJAT-50079]MBS4209951.1 DUF421 domain-containing protein [Bacillus sp. FJAT-50079]